ncbi:Flp pilus assembly protein TadG [Rhizobium sp. NFR03]|nr:Flp pilus assembly protein TadG [Rhizobium sp. NFR03]
MARDRRHNGRRSFALFRSLLVAKDGNVAITVALAMVPMILAVGASVDYIRSYNARQSMQSDLDAALIAAVKEIDTEDKAALTAKVSDWFHAQADSDYTLADVNIDVSTHRITATATGSIPTTLMQIASIKTVPVSVQSAVQGPSTSFLNVYVVLDKSPSMLLAATAAGQDTMYRSAGCQFACHAEQGPTVGGVSYANNYAYSKANGIKLRADVSIDAVHQVIDLIDKADTNHDRIKVGLYTIGDTAAEVLAPTLDMSMARRRLNDDSSGLTSATSTTHTYFDVSLSDLDKKVGNGSDGTSAEKPLKLVLMLTDGVQSQREWVTAGVKWNGNKIKTPGWYWNKIAPLNPAWCDPIKKHAATIAVLYTEYLPITTDWGYNNTVGATMASADWKNTWGGVMKSGVPTSTTRRDYVPYALADCASSKSLFIGASSSTEITAGLSTLFKQYLTSVRLIN